MKPLARRLAMSVLWPSFLAAALAEGFFFALVEPEVLFWTMAPMAVYSLGFFFFWAVCTAASTLTYYVLAVPDDHGRP
ncbi:hypothetical protein [Massilia glaciei]|uniref:Uncharacterized protein n=1 Tax=Massilia glaciei TaxID=1524097 RepID=A0A2U2I4R1_9BURK|nr:hypothetical protein [Massilia glaciei]PWF54790.1 hypothetical protein C7C56_005185 [Massilia glaciei]